MSTTDKSKTSAKDLACEADRLFSETHPDHRSLLRPMVPGEFGWAIVSTEALVLLTWTGPAVRSRKVVLLLPRRN